MPSRSMVVDGDNGIVGAFGHGTDDVGHPFLHFGIGPLDGIELDCIAKFSGIHRGNSTAAHTNSIVVASHDNHLVSLGGAVFKAVLFSGKSYATRLHNYLVESVLLFAFFVFEGEK